MEMFCIRRNCVKIREILLWPRRVPCGEAAGELKRSGWRKAQMPRPVRL